MWIIKERKKQKERVDKLKNKAKVISKVIQNPLATEREIASELWLWNWTVHNHLKELEQNWAKSQAIEEIIEKDVKIVNLAQNILQSRMEKEPEKISNRDLISASDISAKRYSLLKWQATDKEWWLKQIQDITINIIWKDAPTISS